MSDAQREMTLIEWCNRLPESHLVNQELRQFQQQIENMKKYKFFFECCSCLFAEGVEFMTKTEIYEKIKQEVKKLEGLTRKWRER